MRLKNFLKTLYGISVSLKLAVFILLLLAVLTAIGTFLESRFDQETANKLLYQSFWMRGALILLAINLLAVLIDRWPWKKKHLPFVLAHVGILTVLLGALMTAEFGLDGSLRLKEGEQASSFVLPSEEIVLYSSYDGEKFTQLFQSDVDFFRNRPSFKKPYTISSHSEKFSVKDYMPFGLARKDYRAAKGKEIGTPALRFYLEGRMGRFVEWMELSWGKERITRDLGPAEITLTKDMTYRSSSFKELVFYVKGEELFYSLNKGKKAFKPGQVFSTGWMDFQLRLIEFFPNSEKFFVFSSKKRPSGNTVPAIQVFWQNKKAWLGRNSYIRFYDKDKVYALGYLNTRRELGFYLRLLDFQKTNYQGSGKAMSYKSLLETPKGQALISMNEPLKFRGYTFYQAGFEEGDLGAPEVSILSVNRDPGRPLKYAGAAALIIGVILLFYQRRVRFLGDSYNLFNQERF